MQYFEYGETQTDYLCRKDKRLGEVIRLLGHIDRAVIPDLFEALINCIIGQQISSRAQETIWNRVLARFAPLTPERICALPAGELKECGISMRKEGYIRECAARAADGRLPLNRLSSMTDPQIVECLCELPGIGVWTAQMLLIFSIQRPDVLSYGDLAIQRGLRMLYHHRSITPELFMKYKRRYSPYGTVAGFYLWAVAGGRVPGMKDYAPKAGNKTGGKKGRGAGI